MLRPEYDLIIYFENSGGIQYIEVSLFDPEQQPEVSVRIKSIADNTGVKCSDLSIGEIRITWANYYTPVQILEEVFGLIKGSCAEVEKMSLTSKEGAKRAMAVSPDQIPVQSINKLLITGTSFWLNIKTADLIKAKEG